MSIKITVDTCTYVNHLWVAFVCHSQVCVQQFRPSTLSIEIVLKVRLKRHTRSPANLSRKTLSQQYFCISRRPSLPQKSLQIHLLLPVVARKQGRACATVLVGTGKWTLRVWLVLAIGAGWFAS
ncbi:hypothetical protein BDM02DRAFT_3117364, partial [Thelephora ganbajun]